MEEEVVVAEEIPITNSRKSTITSGSVAMMNQVTSRSSTMIHQTRKEALVLLEVVTLQDFLRLLEAFVTAVLKSYTWTKGGSAATTDGATESTEDAVAAVHPSPLVQANFGGRGRGRGRGHAGGRFGHVQEILASKTWVRKKDASTDGTAAGTEGGQE